MVAVWEGIRRTHGAPPEQATPLMPPSCRRPRRLPHHQGLEDHEPARRTDLAGLRDRALMLVGFFAALRRTELVGLDVDQISPSTPTAW